MKARRVFLPMIVVLSLGICQSPAGFEAFLNVAGVPGESTGQGHTNEIDVLSFSGGVSNLASNSPPGGSSQPQFAALTVFKWLDKSSPMLALKCATGQSLSDVTLSLRYTTGGKAEFYRVTLNGATVTSVSTSGSAGEARPTESVSFNFSKITWRYQPVDANYYSNGPPVVATYDLSVTPP